MYQWVTPWFSVNSWNKAKS